MVLVDKLYSISNRSKNNFVEKNEASEQKLSDNNTPEQTSTEKDKN